MSRSGAGDTLGGPALQQQQHQHQNQIPKFSRYRSTRGKSVPTVSNDADEYSSTSQDDARSQVREDPSAAVPAPAPANSIARSMSRYRRHAASVSVDNNATPKIAAPQQRDQPSMPPVPVIPSTLKAGSHGQGNFSFPRDKDGEPPIHYASSPSPPSARRDRTLRHTERATSDLNRNLKDRPISPTDDYRRQRMAEADDRGRRRQDEHDDTTKQTARRAKDNDRATAKQKRELERLQVSVANQPQPAFLSSNKPRSPVVEKFVALTKRRKSKEGLSPTSSTAGSVAGSVDFGRSHTDLPEVPKVPVGIEVGGKGIVPQKDAPVSAVNHGDRIVSVQCRHHTFILPVTPETTPIDIVLATAKNMTYDLEWSPQECVVHESYGPLGLTRRIRRFECIRDVMNSWDRDTHNHLTVTASNDARQDHDLNIESVPEGEEPPRGIQLYMYHSNRPGKWNKRWITLTDQGQIICAKKPDATPSEKDTLSLCHLSDYDIYTPTETQMRRRLKPPKRHCIAIKSQHKPAMFLDTENYVQYFSTDDPGVAALFSEKVQGWRSWYLVDRRPAPRRISITKTDEKPPQLPFVQHTPKKSVSVATDGSHRLKISVDESPYAIGVFEPLLDMKRFDKRLSQFGQDFLPPQPDVSTMPKPASHSKSDSQGSKPEGALIGQIRSINDEAFTGNGLLGRGYEARKASVDQGVTHTRRFSKDHGDFGAGAFMDGPSLLNKQGETDAATKVDLSWFPSALEHSAKHRVVEKPRPNTSAGVGEPRPQNRRIRSHSRPPVPPVPALPQSTSARSDRPPISLPRPLGSHDPLAVGGSPAPTGRRQLPPPLVNLTTPTIKEPPQWSKKGHGVAAPEGMHHLVDLISVGGPKDKPNGLLEIPPRSALRRNPMHTPPLMDGSPNASPIHRTSGGLSRTRSKSSGAPPGRPLIDEVPPVPVLPGGRTMTMGEKDRAKMDAMREAMMARDREFKERERGRARDRGRERETRREFHSTGRAGTLKVV